jgi:hypothetical protein
MTNGRDADSPLLPGIQGQSNRLLHIQTAA